LSYKYFDIYQLEWVYACVGISIDGSEGYQRTGRYKQWKWGLLSAKMAIHEIGVSGWVLLNDK